MRIFPSLSRVMKANSRSTSGLTTSICSRQRSAMGSQYPTAAPPHGIDADPDCERSDRLHVHHVSQIVHIGSDVIVVMNGGRPEGLFKGHAPDLLFPVFLKKAIFSLPLILIPKKIILDTTQPGPILLHNFLRKSLQSG